LENKKLLDIWVAKKQLICQDVKKNFTAFNNKALSATTMESKLFSCHDLSANSNINLVI
jgi:hypothetical protein